MKTIGRDKVRGKHLDHDCYSAHITRHEFGMDDARVFCYGLCDVMMDEPLGKCKVCKAFVQNAEPPEEEKMEVQDGNQ